MILNCVHVYVKKEFINDFIRETKKNHAGAVKEKGNFRFDISQDFNNPGKFLLYEAYETESAVIAHKQTEHYLNWKKKVSDWMEKPRKADKYNLLFPEKK